MVRGICRDGGFLAQKADAETGADLPAADGLLEKLIARKDGCVGMAADMIGVNKRIIAFDNGGEYMLIYSPEIVKKSCPFDAGGLPVPYRHAKSEALEVR